MVSVLSLAAHLRLKAQTLGKPVQRKKACDVLTTSKAMDISVEPLHMPLNHWLRHLLHAT